MVIEEAEKKVQSLIAQYNNNELDAIPGMTVEETLERRIIEILNRVRNSIGRIILDIASDDNPTIIMANSGSRGNIVNLAQMASCVGQQALRGRRIERGYRRRSLAMFKENDLSPEAKGFVKHGFKQGLVPTEFFFSAMTGRDSLMDTALRTPKSGYLYRRLANALQDLKVEYDYTVRDANKTIVQFVYGNDNIDVSKSEGGYINIKKIVEQIKGE